MLKKILVVTLAVIVAGFILPGVEISSLVAALVVGILLIVLNAIVKPVLVVLTFPITLVTLGLFLFFINAFIVYLADSLVVGFSVTNVWWAILFSLVVSFLTSFLDNEKSETEKH